MIEATKENIRNIPDECFGKNGLLKLSKLVSRGVDNNDKRVIPLAPEKTYRTLGIVVKREGENLFAQEVPDDFHFEWTYSCIIIRKSQKKILMISEHFAITYPEGTNNLDLPNL